jgi:hypothetical protein
LLVLVQCFQLQWLVLFGIDLNDNLTAWGEKMRALSDHPHRLNPEALVLRWCNVDEIKLLGAVLEVDEGVGVTHFRAAE